MALVKVHFDSNARDYAAWLSEVPELIQIRLKEEAPSMKRRTKKVVQNHLVQGRGVEEGIYRRSFTINDYSQSKWELAFQVYAKKPHYRLTHLLEDGHKTVLFRRNRGRPTKWGNIGMIHTGTRKHPLAHTNNIHHILPGQEYAEKQFPILYDEGVNAVLKQGMRRIK